MPMLGLITCEVLEEEWAYLLANDPDIERIMVLEDTRSQRFIDALEERGCSGIVKIPHITAYKAEPSAGIGVIVKVQEFALHRSRNVLRQALRESVQEMSRYTDAILLGYGLCGNALDHPEEITDGKIPLFILMDDDHPVDDCVGLLLGGRKRYYGEQCRVPGTFFMTPGWTRHWRRLLDKNDTQTPEALNASLLRVFRSYERYLLVVTPVLEEEMMEKRCQPFADLLGIRPEVCQGTMEILETTWQTAKDYLMKQGTLGRAQVAE